MSIEKDIMKHLADRINTECRYGDKVKACKAADTTPTTLQNALKRRTIEELSDGELATITELIKILDERKDTRNEIHRQYATN